MLSPSVFALAICKVDEALQQIVGFDFPKIKISVCKVLLETTDFTDIKTLDGKYSNATLTWCYELRKSEPFVNLDLQDEKLVYQTLIKIYKSK